MERFRVGSSILVGLLTEDIGVDAVEENDGACGRSVIVSGMCGCRRVVLMEGRSCERKLTEIGHYIHMDVPAFLALGRDKPPLFTLGLFSR